MFGVNKNNTIMKRLHRVSEFRYLHIALFSELRNFYIGIRVEFWTYGIGLHLIPSAVPLIHGEKHL